MHTIEIAHKKEGISPCNSTLSFLITQKGVLMNFYFSFIVTSLWIKSNLKRLRAILAECVRVSPRSPVSHADQRDFSGLALLLFFNFSFLTLSFFPVRYLRVVIAFPLLFVVTFPFYFSLSALGCFHGDQLRLFGLTLTCPVQNWRINPPPIDRPRRKLFIYARHEPTASIRIDEMN